MKHSLLVILLLFSFTLKSKETRLEVVTENWPPFILQEKEVAGIVTKNVRDILKYSNIDYAINIYPWARSFHLATTTPNTLIYSIYRTKERESKFHWFCPIYKSTPIHVYKLASNNLNIDSLAPLKKGIVGIMRGDNSHNYFLQKGFQAGVNLDLSANEFTNLRKLIGGRVDVVVQSEASLNYRLALLGAKDLKVVAGVAIAQAENAQHCMALSLETAPEVVNQIKAAFKQWQAQQ